MTAVVAALAPVAPVDNRWSRVRDSSGVESSRTESDGLFGIESSRIDSVEVESLIRIGSSRVGSNWSYKVVWPVAVWRYAGSVVVLVSVFPSRRSFRFALSTLLPVLGFVVRRVRGEFRLRSLGRGFLRASQLIWYYFRVFLVVVVLPLGVGRCRGFVLAVLQVF
jgi:hypothetical protein